MALTGEQFTIRAGEHEATVVEVGAGLRRYAHGGADVTAGYDADALPPKCCGGVLVPWPNRVRGGRYAFGSAPYQLALTEPAAGNAIHGLGRWDRWTPLRRDPASVTLALDIVPQAGWPFEVGVEVTYSLDEATGLTVTATAVNHGTIAAPFGAGFHPYLSCRGAALDEVRLSIPAATQLVLDETKIPIGSTPVAGTPFDLRESRRLGPLRMDDCFTDLIAEPAADLIAEQTADPAADPAVSPALEPAADPTADPAVEAVRAGGRVEAWLQLPFGQRTTLWADAAFGYLQVFTLDTFPGSGGAAVAIEPMSCAPDAFNSGAGLVTLQPGESWTGRWGITPG